MIEIKGTWVTLHDRLGKVIATAQFPKEEHRRFLTSIDTEWNKELEEVKKQTDHEAFAVMKTKVISRLEAIITGVKAL